MTIMNLSPRDDGWELPVSGQRITRLCFDNEDLGLLCENMIEIKISEPFILLDPDQQSHLLDPGPRGASLAPALRIMRQVLQEGIAFYDGRLELRFRDASRINVPAGTDFEAWHLNGPGGVEGLKIVSIPGGELAIWPDGRKGSAT
jgi:hypothetical protein